MRTTAKENLQADKQVSLQTYMAANLDEKATAVGSFRMSVALLDKLDDVQHLLKKRFKIRLSKKQIVAMALAFTFWDLEQKGEKSGLVRANKDGSQRKLTS
jgi:hypothetical protein